MKIKNIFYDKMDIRLFYFDVASCSQLNFRYRAFFEQVVP